MSNHLQNRNRLKSVSQHFNPLFNNLVNNDENKSGNNSKSKSIQGDPASIDFYPYLVRSSVSFRDCDMYCHVNNATYYHYFDNLFNTFFVEQGGMNPTNGPIVGLTAWNSCSYKSEISFPGHLLLGLRVIDIGNSSTKIQAAVFKQTINKNNNINNTSDSVNETGQWRLNDKEYLSSLDPPLDKDNWTLAAIGNYVWVFCQREENKNSKMRPTTIPTIMRNALIKAMPQPKPNS